MKSFNQLSNYSLFRIICALKGNKVKTISIIGERNFENLSAFSAIVSKPDGVLNAEAKTHLQVLVQKTVEGWGTSRLQRTIDKICITD